MSSGLLQVLVELGNLHRTTSFNETMGVACSDFVSYNQVQVLSILVLLLASSEDWTCNIQKIVSLEAQRTNAYNRYHVSCWAIQSEFLGIINLMFLLWLELLLSCKIFYLCSYSDFFLRLQAQSSLQA